MYISNKRKSDFDMNLFAELCLFQNKSFCKPIGPWMDCLRINASREVSWVNLEGIQSTKMIYQSNSDKTKTCICKKINFLLLSTCVPVGLKMYSVVHHVSFFLS